MSQVSEYALARLQSLLPLAQRQAALSPELRRIHQHFLQSLIDKGHPPTRDEIAALASGNDAAFAIWILAAADLIVLGRDGSPAGAYPVTAEPTPYRVTIGNTCVCAMCALDAVSVAPMFDTRVIVESRCAVTGVEIHIEQEGNRVLRASAPELQVGIWWRNPGSIAARNLCPGIVFLRDRAAARAWQDDLGDHEFAELADAIDAGGRFFRPLVLAPAEAQPAAHH